MPPLDLTGQSFGRLIVERRLGTGANKQVVWQCSCECGSTEVKVTTALLRRSRKPVRSCGCLAAETRRANGVTGAANFAIARRDGSNITPQFVAAAARVGPQNLAKFRATESLRVCPRCKKEFLGRGRKVYCSEECRGGFSAGGNDKCEQCGGPMDRRGYRRVYCSRVCKRTAGTAKRTEAAVLRLAEELRAATKAGD